MNLNIRKLLLSMVTVLPVASGAVAEAQLFCIEKQAPNSYEKYKGAVAEISVVANESMELKVRYATGGQKAYRLPFLFNDMYSNEETFISVSFRDNGKEIYFSDPDRNDWFSASLCG